MTMQTDELDTQEQQAADDQGQPADETSVATAEASAREKELQDRLASQGRTVSELRRNNELLASQLAQTNQAVAELRDGLTAQQRERDERDQAATQAWLESLPDEQRTREELRLANERVTRLEKVVSGRNGGAPPQSSGSPSQPQPKETPEQYQTRRMREIITEAQEEFGVTLTRADLETIPESDWDRERTFHRAVFASAARKQAGGTTQKAVPVEGDDVAEKKKAAAASSKAETPEEMEARIRKNVLRDLGVSGAAAPRAAAVRRNGPPPTEEDVREAMGSYDSSAGPKANIARLKKLREQMG